MLLTTFHTLPLFLLSEVLVLCLLTTIHTLPLFYLRVKILRMYAHKNCATVKINPYGGYACPYSEFQNLSFRILRKKQYRCQNFPIVFALLSVTVTVSTHLCVICCHFCFRMTLFQGHVACQNCTLTGPSD